MSYPIEHSPKRRLHFPLAVSTIPCSSTQTDNLSHQSTTTLDTWGTNDYLLHDITLNNSFNIDNLKSFSPQSSTLTDKMLFPKTSIPRSLITTTINIPDWILPP